MHHTHGEKVGLASKLYVGHIPTSIRGIDQRRSDLISLTISRKISEIKPRVRDFSHGCLTPARFFGEGESGSVVQSHRDSRRSVISEDRWRGEVSWEERDQESDRCWGNQRQ